MYNKISELLFQISNASVFVFPFIYWQLSCAELRAIGSEVQRHIDASFWLKLINITFGVKEPPQLAKI